MDSEEQRFFDFQQELPDGLKTGFGENTNGVAALGVSKITYRNLSEAIDHAEVAEVFSPDEAFAHRDMLSQLYGLVDPDLVEDKEYFADPAKHVTKKGLGRLSVREVAQEGYIITFATVNPDTGDVEEEVKKSIKPEALEYAYDHISLEDAISQFPFGRETISVPYPEFEDIKNGAEHLANAFNLMLSGDITIQEFEDITKWIDVATLLRWNQVDIDDNQSGNSSRTVSYHFPPERSLNDE